MDEIARHLQQIRQRIKTVAESAGRDPDTVRLVAVSKGKTENDVRTAIKAGHRLFGENRVQEAKGKYELLRKICPELELHLIGPLQSNKAEEAVRLFDVIETLDRPRLAEALAAAIKKTGCTPRFYIEVNLGAEPQKAGIAPEELAQFLRFCQVTCGLKVEGLMCIPPKAVDVAPHFQRLRELALQHGLVHLSMGMSEDFDIAIKCGATEVRIGTAIFGARG